MPYTINLTDGSVLVSVADGTVDTDSTSVTLIGRNFSGFGDQFNENIVHVLENFNNTTSPSNPITGQLWYDRTNEAIKVYNGSAFKIPPGATPSSTQPTEVADGDLWFDSANSQLRVYDGSSFVLVGPNFTTVTGVTGQVIDTVSDGTSNHVIIKELVSGTVVAIISKDASFVPNPSIAGFSTINPGYNVASNISDIGFAGGTFINTTLTSPVVNGKLRITQTGADDVLVVEDSANPDNTPFLIDDTGRVLIGSATSQTFGGSTTIPFQVNGLTFGSAAIAIANWGNVTTGPGYILSKSKSGTVGTHTIVASGNQIGLIQFEASDGTGFIEAAKIEAYVDGTPGTNDMPSRLVFSTTADGASTATERMRINSSGNIGVGGAATLTSGVVLQIENGSNSSTVVQLSGTGLATGQISTNNSTELVIKNVSTGDLVLGTDNTERVRVKSDGTVDASGNTVKNLNLRNYSEYATTIANASASQTVPSDANVVRYTITQATAITLPASMPAPSSAIKTIVLFLKQNATGGFAVTLSAPAGESIVYNNSASQPSVNTSANKVSIYSCMKFDGDTKWYVSLSYIDA